MDIVKHYIADAEAFDYQALDSFAEQEYRRRYETLFHMGNFKPGTTLLEIGSGGGPGKSLSQERKLRHIALDISLHNLQRLRDNTGWTTPVCAEAYRLPFAEGTLSYVLISEVLEHIPDPVAALRECHRILSPGGRIVLSVPWHEYIPLHLCIHCNRPTPTHAHLHSIDEKKLEGWLQSAGFTEIATDTVLNKPANRLSLNRLLHRLPYRPWRLVDRLCNRLIRRPATLVASALKG